MQDSMDELEGSEESGKRTQARPSKASGVVGGVLAERISSTVSCFGEMLAGPSRLEKRDLAAGLGERTGARPTAGLASPGRPALTRRRV